MYIEHLDGRYAGQVRDIENGAALDLINLGRAKRAFAEPSHAMPIAAGGFRDTTNVVARLDEPTDKPFVAWDTATKAPVSLAVPAAKKHKGR